MARGEWTKEISTPASQPWLPYDRVIAGPAIPCSCPTAPHLCLATRAISTMLLGCYAETARPSTSGGEGQGKEDVTPPPRTHATSQQISGKAISPSLMPLGSIHPQASHQGQLHCVVWLRHRAHSLKWCERWGQLSRVSYPVRFGARSVQSLNVHGISSSCPNQGCPCVL